MITQRKYRKYDSESYYYAMGYRMYSAEFGRFLAVDPLFEAMPRHNPYHYGYNSPMFWSDPSGLAPEKEKNIHSEKLLEWLIDWEVFRTGEAMVTASRYEIDYTAAEYDAGFADDSHLRSMGRYIPVGVSSGRSLRSTLGFGPGTYDPYNINTSIGPVGASSSKKPKSWDGKGITNFFRNEINEISDLQFNLNTEHGFLVIWNHTKQEMRASKYIKGKNDRKLSTIQDMLKEITLEYGDVVLGFFHSHGTNKTDQKISFGTSDFRNFNILVEAIDFSYTKIPTDRSSMLMGVVTPLTIEILQVGDVEAFQELWKKVSSLNDSKLKYNFFHKPSELGGVKYYIFPRSSK